MADFAANARGSATRHGVDRSLPPCRLPDQPVQAALSRRVAWLQRRFTAARQRLAAWRVSETGSISVETVLILPVLLWALTASIAFTDAFRQQSTLLRSTYTVSDLISSSTRITPEDIDGIFAFLRRMNDTAAPINLRVSLVGFDMAEDRLRVVWSNATHAGAAGLLTDDDLAEHLATRIPMITQGETIVLTETWLDYTPPFFVGLTRQVFAEVTVMRPRFGPGVRYDDPNAPAPPPAWCTFILDGCGM